MFRRNIFPRRPLANSGIGKHTTGISTSEAEALLSRRAGCHAVVAWAHPGACRLTRAVLRAASTRRCMREAGAAPPAALSPEPGPPKRGSAPTAPRPPWGLAGEGGRGGGIAEPQPSQPGAGGRAASASRPVRSRAPSASRSPTLPRAFWPSHTSTALASGRSLLGEERAVQRRLRDPRPPAARPTHPRYPRGVRAHPASSAGTPRASEPQDWRGPPGGRFPPSGSRDGGGVRPHTPSPTSGPAVSPGAPSGRAVPLRPPLPSRAWLCPRSRRGKVCAPGRLRRPACSPPPLPGHAVRGSRAPRGGVRARPGPPFLSPSPASSYPAAKKASRRRGCIVLLLLLRLLSPGWQARKAGAASPPHAASANLPSSPRPSGSAAPRSRRRPAAPRRARGRALPRCRSPHAPSALARSLSPLLSATCRLRV